MSRPVSRLSLARVAQSLACGPQDVRQAGGPIFEGDDGQAVAMALLRLGGGWSAVRELAAGPAAPGPVEGIAARLAAQASDDMAGTAALPFWDTLCGFVGRSWRLGVDDSVGALYRMDSLWWTARDFDRSTSQGLRLIWQGMGLKELSDHVDVTRDATALLDEADALLPADLRDSGLCVAVLEAVR